MKNTKVYFAILLLFSLSKIQAQQNTYNTAKPWAYWWWMGSAVTKDGISKNLKDYANAGFGGLHIIPIYGVKGEESKFIPYMSQQWLEMLDFTVQEAKRLNLGIDMTLGTGWPFGGSQVTEKYAAQGFKVFKNGDIWQLEMTPTRQKVKRAAPGAEGLVLDHFNGEAVTNYLDYFKNAFAQKNYGVRAFYNDSYEVYGANWTANFLTKFKEKRGYDLEKYLGVFAKDTAETDIEKRVWADYHETISDLLYEEFTTKWVDFAHSFGKIARNEAHGSPANILDLYALSDIPESEFFGSKPYQIPLYRQDEDYSEKQFGVPDVLALKFASSASNVTGKKLTASETSTWLANHFKVSLSQIKPIIDESFIGGINHIFYHGMPYSLPDANFPGWLFYASTNYNQQSHFWETLPLLNSYVTYNQEILQNTKPDNDVLVYFPIYDLWHTAGKKGKTHSLDIHSFKGTILNTHFGKTIQTLQQKGFAIDYISDRQLLNCSASAGKVITQGKQPYSVIVIPECSYMPLATLEMLAKLKKQGVKIAFVNHLPQSVNGLDNLEQRQAQFNKTLPVFKENITTDVVAGLKKLSVRYESMTEQGLSFIRKKKNNSTVYFISNLGNQFKSGKIILASGDGKIAIHNADTKETKYYPFKRINASQTEIPLTLLPGQSILLEISPNMIAEGSGYSKIPKDTITLSGNWQVEFTKGEPFLPKSYQTQTLQSWTLAGDTLAQYYSGKAKYSLSFSVSEAKAGKTGWLDLGDVRETATVILNGRKLGTAWYIPFRVYVPESILKKENKLEIEVTNLSANRVRYLDKTGVNWRKFYDINFVDITYKPFDASKWKPVSSGLLGPVKLLLEENTKK